MQNQDRKTGYYWVRSAGIWVVAYYCEVLKRWRIPGVALPWYDTDFGEIREVPLQDPDGMPY